MPIALIGIEDRSTIDQTLPARSPPSSGEPLPDAACSNQAVQWLRCQAAMMWRGTGAKALMEIVHLAIESTIPYVECLLRKDLPWHELGEVPPDEPKVAECQHDLKT